MKKCSRCGDEQKDSLGRQSNNQTGIVCNSCGLLAEPEQDFQLSDESLARIKKLNSLKQKKQLREKENNRRLFFGLSVVFATILVFLPSFNGPLMALKIFFHELSHGIATLLMGGEISQILFNHEAGLIYTSELGQLGAFVGWAGYAGTPFWGALFYRIGLRANAKECYAFIVFLVFLLGVTTYLWIRNHQSMATAIMVYVPFSLSLYMLRSPIWSKRLMGVLKFFGIFTAVESFISPCYMFTSQSNGDWQHLATLTGIPANFWAAQWGIIAMYGLWLIWSMEMKSYTTQKTSKAGRLKNSPSMVRVSA